MSAQSSDAVEKLPSIANASTNEEDYFFTSLGLDDEDGSNVDGQDEQDRNGSTGMKFSEDLLRPRNREDRMRAAYEESKRLYKAQHGYTESGWYIGLDKHPYEYTSQVVSSKSGNIHLNSGEPVEVDQKMIDSNVAYAFYTGNYRESLNILLGRIETDDTPPPAVSPTSENEKILKNRVDNLSREMFDTAMRTCVKLNDVKWAGYVADASQKYWKMPGHAGLAESASRAYHTAKRYNDSIIALFYAIADRGALYAYLVAAQQTLQVYGSSTTPIDAQPQDASLDMSATFSQFLDLIEWVIGNVPASYAEPLFSELPGVAGGDKEEINRPPKEQGPPPSSVTTSESYMRFGEELAEALMPREKDLEISRKAWKKLGQLISLRLKVGTTESSQADEGETTNMGRSVRSL